MKRILSLLAVLALLASAGCSAPTAESGPENTADSTADSAVTINGYTVKTGVSYADPWGITVANVIEKDGELFKILFDTVRPDGGLSSKEKYNDYGIGTVSTIGKEWWEQIIFVEDFAQENGVDGFEMTEDGYAGNPDAVTGATFHVVYFLDALKNVNAGVTDAEGYSVKTGVSYADPWGITVANVIYKDGELFKILFDTVRPDGGLSSKEKYNDYGIGAVSTIGKEWWEQIIFVEDFAQENGVDGFEMTEDGYAGNPDAVTGATFHVVYFLDALQDALNR